MINKEKFDFDIQEKIDHLIEWSKDIVKENPCFIDITFWDDKDYCIRLVNTYFLKEFDKAQHRHVFEYKKSEDKYCYIRQRMISAEMWQTLEKK